MKKTAVALSLVLIGLLASVLILTVPVKAQEPLNLTIKPDGSVEPSTNLLERNGTTYTFKGDIFGTICVQKNNIIIDGAGQTFQGNGIATGQNSDIGILLGGTDLSHRECSAVLVENLRIDNIPRGIFSVGGSNNSFIGNYFDNSGIEIQGNANLTGNLIKHNTLINTFISFDYDPNGTDIITENNFVNSTIYVWLAKGPIVDRNYWSDYNGTDADGDGIGDTPYGHSQAILDNHPLMKPVSSATPEFPDGASNTPTVPEFTVAIVASSLEVTIKNQPITAFVDTNSSNPSLYYGFRFKDHENIQDWNYDPLYYVLPSTYGTYYEASNFDYTVVSFTFESYPLTGILGSGKVDVQVMALIGNEFPTNYENGTVYGFDGVTSVWSSTQTIAIDENTSINQVPFSTLIIVAVIITVVIVFSIGVIVYFKRHKR